MGRGRGTVAPVIDDDEEDKYSRMDKQRRRRPSPPPAPPRRRLLPARGWLGIFILINVVAIAGFIFASAWYFPSTSTAGVVEQAIMQGDMSLLELPRVDDDKPQGNDEPLDLEKDSLEAPSLTPTISATSSPHVETPLSTQLPQDPSKDTMAPDDKHRIKESVEATAVVQTTQPPAVEPKQPSDETDLNAAGGHVSIAPEAPIETNPPQIETLEPLTPAITSAIEPEATSLVPVVRSHSMEEVLLRLKGDSKSPSSQPTKEATPEVTIVETNGKESEREVSQTPQSTLHEETAINEGPKQEISTASKAVVQDDEGLETNLVTWLKADEGVQTENAAECEALGTGCEVTSWKSVARAQLDLVVFQPVNSRMRPMLQPASQNELPTVSFSCGMTHTSGLALHESMSLFFVLSPAQIEHGDTYTAQKFFGNAPYGQFLLHGGKPAFFTAAGLVESTFVASVDQLLLMTYRLHRQAVEIKVNGLAWSPKETEYDKFSVRVSGNAALSLGNVKGVCDTNAFQGRIAEVLVYDAVLSDGRVDAVEHYLQEKWWGKKLPVTAKPAAEADPSEDRVDRAEAVDQPTSPTISFAPHDAAQATTERKIVRDSAQPQSTQQAHQEGQEQASETPAQQELPSRTFDPEGVFEWLPSPELLALIAKEDGSDPNALVDKWKLAVSEKVALVRNFQLGGEVLRTFIRERRDELLTLRDEMFGS